MVAPLESKLIFAKLELSHQATIERGRWTIFVRLIKQKSQLELVTTVYKGEAFIPQSVRLVSMQPLDEPFKDVHPWICLQEDRFEILLCFRRQFFGVSSGIFHEIASQFDDTAQKWREIFEKHEKQDLIYITALR